MISLNIWISLRYKPFLKISNIDVIIFFKCLLKHKMQLLLCPDWAQTANGVRKSIIWVNCHSFKVLHLPIYPSML